MLYATLIQRCACCAAFPRVKIVSQVAIFASHLHAKNAYLHVRSAAREAFVWIALPSVKIVGVKYVAAKHWKHVSIVATNVVNPAWKTPAIGVVIARSVFVTKKGSPVSLASPSASIVRMIIALLICVKYVIKSQKQNGIVHISVEIAVANALQYLVNMTQQSRQVVTKDRV